MGIKDILKKGIELGEAYKAWEIEVEFNTGSDKEESMRFFMMDNSNFLTPILIEKGILIYHSEDITYEKTEMETTPFFNEVAEVYCSSSGIITYAENDYYEVCKRIGMISEKYQMVQ